MRSCGGSVERKGSRRQDRTSGRRNENEDQDENECAWIGGVVIAAGRGRMYARRSAQQAEQADDDGVSTTGSRRWGPLAGESGAWTVFPVPSGFLGLTAPRQNLLRHL